MALFKKCGSQNGNKSRLVSAILAVVMVFSVCAFVGCSDKDADAGYKAVVEDFLKEMDTDYFGYVTAQKGKFAISYDDTIKGLEADSALISAGLDEAAVAAKDAAVASVAAWESAYGKDTYAISVEYAEENKMNEKALNYKSSEYSVALKRDVKVEDGYSLKCKVTFGEGETAVVRDFEFETYKIGGKWYIGKAVDASFGATETAVKDANAAAKAIKDDVDAQKKALEEASALSEE